MSKGPSFTELELKAIWRLRNEDKLTWRKVGEIMRRDPVGLCRAYKQYFKSPRMGRPIVRMPAGDLLCTLGNHAAPFTEFPVHPRGHIDSWCKECRRVRDRKQKAIKARAARAQSQMVTRSIADNSCARYPQD